ncbi:MAG: hypothetical protein DRO12_05350, partial [Thermoprotei archaeon]
MLWIWPFENTLICVEFTVSDVKVPWKLKDSANADAVTVLVMVFVVSRILVTVTNRVLVDTFLT